MASSAHPPADPFTLVVCTYCHTEDSDSRDRLQRTVRSCPHGVMVSTGCLQKMLHCRSDRGLHAVVQPCEVNRSPTGPLVRIGPLKTAVEVDAVAVWLEKGRPDDGTLPDHLHAAPARRHVSWLN